jgi:hypothetical protein
LHLAVEDDFRPAHKAHPALIVDDFDDLVAKLDAVGASLAVGQGSAGNAPTLRG